MNETSLHLRRARAGDAEAAGWLIARLHPLLLAQARLRLSGRLAAQCDPEDLVADAWVVALPRLATLPERDDRATPVLLRFLGTTLVQLANNLARKAARRAIGPGPREAEERPEDAAPDPTRGVVTRAVRRETGGRALAELDALDPIDREIVILRGVEQVPGAEVAARMGISANAVSLRYRRALTRLRERLAGAVFDELPDDDAAT